MKTIDEQLMNGLTEETNKSPRPTKDIFFAGGCCLCRTSTPQRSITRTTSTRILMVIATCLCRYLSLPDRRKKESIVRDDVYLT